MDDAAKLKLPQAKEKLEDAVWLDPSDLNGRIPYKNVKSNGRLREISGKMSKFLRGHALADGLPSPDMNFADLSKDWVELTKPPAQQGSQCRGLGDFPSDPKQ